MTARERPLRVLFLGCGEAARSHSRVLRRVHGTVLSYASRDGARAEALRRAFGGAAAFGSYEEGLAAEGDVAIVATPTVSHLELTLAAVRSGRQVVVEKPAFMSASDADIVRSVASSSSRQVLVAENYAYKPITILLHRLVTEGAIGDVRFVTINATKRQRATGWRADPALAGGGALFEGGVHWISFAASLGLDVESAHGYATGGAESRLVVLRYTNGGVGTIAHSWELPAPLGGLRLSKIQGTRGAVTFESNGFAMYASGGRRSLRFPGVPDPRGMRAMWRDFIAALHGESRPRFTLDMAQRDLRLLEEAGASAAVAPPATTASSVA